MAQTAHKRLASQGLRKSAPTASMRACVAALMYPVVFSSTGCSLVEQSEYTVRADSLAVYQGPSRDTLQVRVFGTVANTRCGKLERVEKSVRQDTVVRRFVGDFNSQLCIQAPVLLDYSELVHVPAGARIVYAVRQPDGTNLVGVLVPDSASSAVGGDR